MFLSPHKFIGGPQTPGVLVFAAMIQAREERLWRRALHRWATNAHIEVLGTRRAHRLSIVSLRLRHGEKHLHHPHTGLWRHRHAAQAALRLGNLRHTAHGILVGPARQASAGEDVLGGYLHHAADVISRRADAIDDGQTGLPPDFETLRWFHLPPACLTHPDRATAG